MAPKLDPKKTRSKASETDGASKAIEADSAVAIEEDEVDAMIARAVQAALKSFRDDLDATYNAKFAKIESKQTTLVDENTQLRDSVDKLEDQIDKLSQLVASQGDTIIDLQEKLLKCRKHANRNEQYSRKNNLKISGLPYQDKNQCGAAVCEFVRSKLGYAIQDGDVKVAHPVQPRRRPNAQGPPRPLIIVRFRSRQVRHEVLSRRRVLKGSGTVIHEDLTALNMELVNDLENHPSISKAWSWNGKIFGLTKDQRKIVFEPFDDIDAKLSDSADDGSRNDSGWIWLNFFFFLLIDFLDLLSCAAGKRNYQ